jgi:hypothetical protein
MGGDCSNEDNEKNEVKRIYNSNLQCGGAVPNRIVIDVICLNATNLMVARKGCDTKLGNKSTEK